MQIARICPNCYVCVMKSQVFFLLFASLYIVFGFAPVAQSQSSGLPLSNHPHPFFLEGDGKLSIRNVNNGRTVTVELLDKEGKLIPESFDKIDQVFGFPTVEKKEHISLRTLFMLDYFSDQFAPGKTVNLHSGYRSPTYNQGLRNKGRLAARTSTHMDGMAIDFSLPAANGKEMWEIMRHKDCCGAGNYGGNIVHLDSGKPRFWEAATSKVGTDASAFNRFIYLSTEYDRYRAGDRMRLLYTSISDFGFGIKREVQFTTDKEGLDSKTSAKIISDKPGDCLMINQREEARFIYVDLSAKLKPGEYFVKVEFCNKPFTEMPDDRVTNRIEVSKPSEIKSKE